MRRARLYTNKNVLMTLVVIKTETAALGQSKEWSVSVNQPLFPMVPLPHFDTWIPDHFCSIFSCPSKLFDFPTSFSFSPHRAQPKRINKYLACYKKN